MAPVTDQAILDQLNASGPVPVTDKAILTQLNKEDTPIQDTLDQIGHKANAAVTGLFRGVVATGNAIANPAELFGQNKDGPHNMPTTAEMLDFTNKGLYQPQDRVERGLAAAGAAIPAVLSRNPRAFIASALGGGLGEEMANNPYLKEVMSPDVLRAIGNIAPSLGGIFSSQIPNMLRKTPVLGGAVDPIWNKIKDAVRTPPGEPPLATLATTPSAQRIYEMNQSGKYSPELMEAMAKVNQDRVWNPQTAAKVPGTTQRIVETLLRGAGLFGLGPKVQRDVNAPIDVLQ